MDHLLQKIINWISRTDKRIIIGISGHGAAGKTTFADMLVKRLGETKVNMVNTDPYIVCSQLRKQTMVDYTYQNVNHRYKMTACHPSAHHLPSLERDVRMVREGIDFFTIDAPYLPRKLISSANKVTIVEGMSVAFLNPDIFDLKIYFYTDGETELMRRSGRDIPERGADLDYLRQSHEERRIQYDVFMHPYSERFDVIVKSSDDAVMIEKIFSF